MLIDGKNMELTKAPMPSYEGEIFAQVWGFEDSLWLFIGVYSYVNELNCRVREV